MTQLTKNPFINALAAECYIALVVCLMTAIAEPNQPDSESVFIPMAMLSLFVLSASIMGFLFLAEPLQMYLDNKKKEAVTFFLKTVGSFALFTVIAFFLLLLLK